MIISPKRTSFTCANADLADWLDLLAAPGGRESLLVTADELTAVGSHMRYPVSASPVFHFLLCPR